VTVTYTGAPGPVTALAVSGLDAACRDGRAFATVTAADGSNPTSGTAIVTGSSISITLSTSRAPETVGAWSLVVLGP
jgi:hypothetical protein